MLYYKDEKTVKIPVRINKGRVNYFYGGNLPVMEDRIIGELIVPEYGISDEMFLRISQTKEKLEILPKDSVIMVAVSMKEVPEEKKILTENINESYKFDSLFVKVIIDDPLILLFRGSKKSTLMGCRCTIPVLQREAFSLNNAYTMISEQFEPGRRSHTGNVFRNCFYKDKTDQWYPLDILRETEEGKFEEKMFFDHKTFVLKKGRIPWEVLSDDEYKIIKHLEDKAMILGKDVKKLFEQDKIYITIIHSLFDKGVIEEKAGDGNELE